MKRTKRNIEKSTATEINRLHQEIENALKMSLANAIKIGKRLQEVKENLPHGSFLPWIKENLTFSDQTARNYIKLYDNRNQLTGADSITDAYRMLEPKFKTVLNSNEVPEERTLDSYIKVIIGLEFHPEIAKKIEFKPTGLVFRQQTTREEWVIIGQHLARLNMILPPQK